MRTENEAIGARSSILRSAPVPDRTPLGRRAIIGESVALQEVLQLVDLVAGSDAPILITGETGTGKELVARAIHEQSARRHRPFVSVNCGAIPPTLIASELFGHEKGAFTGAVQRRTGRFELASGGTLFLDEIAELALECQTALLRVLQEREFERVGGTQPIRCDVRIVAATNRDLEDEIAAGRFRADLFYRLNVVPVVMPPLRDRKDDLPLLVAHFIEQAAGTGGRKVRRLSDDSMTLLESYVWPGNVRELQNIVARAVILAQGEEATVEARWLRAPSGAAIVPEVTFAARVTAREKQLIESALSSTRGRVAGRFGAAAVLKLPASTLESKIRMLGIDKARFRPPQPEVS